MGFFRISGKKVPEQLRHAVFRTGHCAEVPVEFFERSDDGIMIEETGQPQETAVASQSVEVVERFVDSSEFIPYHPLSGVVIQAGKSGICPFAHARSYFKSLLIVCIQVLILNISSPVDAYISAAAER